MVFHSPAVIPRGFCISIDRRGQRLFGSSFRRHFKEVISMKRLAKSTTLYTHPFSKAYWRDAVRELGDIKMLVVAALMIALRVALKLVAIPLAPNLKINTAFLANALGAMVFGPVVAAVAAVASDLLGFLVSNDGGVYFLPFVLTEVAGSVIFALFLYRAKLNPTRVLLSRFCICFFVNIVLQTPIMILYYRIYIPGSSYVLTLPSIVKNLFMFPIESVVLSLFLSVVQPITYRLKLTYDKNANFKYAGKQIALLVCLVVIGTASVAGYLVYHYRTTSLSSAYSAEERVEANRSMQALVLENTDEWDDAETVTIVESAYKEFLGKETTYTVAVYLLDTQMLEEKIGAEKADNPKSTYSGETLWGYSKSKAAKDEVLTRAATAVIVVENKTGQVLECTVTPEKAS